MLDRYKNNRRVVGSCKQLCKLLEPACRLTLTLHRGKEHPLNVLWHELVMRGRYESLAGLLGCKKLLEDSMWSPYKLIVC